MSEPKDNRHADARRALLVDPAPGQRKALLEILSCTNCCNALTAVLAMHPEVVQPVVDVKEWADNLRSTLGPAIDKRIQRAMKAKDFLDVLLAAPVEARPALLQDGRRDSLHFFLLALDRASHEAPVEALYLAHLAFDWLDRNPLGVDESELEELRGHAEAVEGHAQRQLGRFEAARSAFDRASRRDLTASVAARLCRWEGLLWWEQGHLDRAEALLRQSARLLGSFVMPQGMGEAWALLGLLLAEKKDPGRSLPLLQAGHECLIPQQSPWLAVQVRLTLAWELAAFPTFESARSVLAGGLTDPEQALLEDPRVQRLEGRLWSAVGEHEQGERLLETARVRLLADRDAAHGALCTLDLLAFLSVQQRTAEMEGLTADFAARFPEEEAVLSCLQGLAQAFLDLLEGGRLRIQSAEDPDLASGGGRPVSAADLLDAFEERLWRVLRLAGHRLLLPVQG